VDECKPLPRTLCSTMELSERTSGEDAGLQLAHSTRSSPTSTTSTCARLCAAKQGLKLVHFSAQLKRYLWDRGCIMHSGAVLGGFMGYQGVLQGV